MFSFIFTTYTMQNVQNKPSKIFINTNPFRSDIKYDSHQNTIVAWSIHKITEKEETKEKNDICITITKHLNENYFSDHTTIHFYEEFDFGKTYPKKITPEKIKNNLIEKINTYEKIIN